MQRQREIELNENVLFLHHLFYEEGAITRGLAPLIWSGMWCCDVSVHVQCQESTLAAIHCGQSCPLKKPRQEISHEDGGAEATREKIYAVLPSSGRANRTPPCPQNVIMLFFIHLGKVLTSPGKHIKIRTTEWLLLGAKFTQWKKLFYILGKSLFVFKYVL